VDQPLGAGDAPGRGGSATAGRSAGSTHAEGASGRVHGPARNRRAPSAPHRGRGAPIRTVVRGVAVCARSSRGPRSSPREPALRAPQLEDSAGIENDERCGRSYLHARPLGPGQTTPYVLTASARRLSRLPSRARSVIEPASGARPITGSRRGPLARCAAKRTNAGAEAPASEARQCDVTVRHAGRRGGGVSRSAGGERPDADGRARAARPAADGKAVVVRASGEALARRFHRARGRGVYGPRRTATCDLVLTGTRTHRGTRVFERDTGRPSIAVSAASAAALYRGLERRRDRRQGGANAISTGSASERILWVLRGRTQRGRCRGAFELVERRRTGADVSARRWTSRSNPGGTRLEGAVRVDGRSSSKRSNGDAASRLFLGIRSTIEPLTAALERTTRRTTDCAPVAIHACTTWFPGVSYPRLLGALRPRHTSTRPLRVRADRRPVSGSVSIWADLVLGPRRGATCVGEGHCR
jgi:hypothetical protein